MALRGEYKQKSQKRSQHLHVLVTPEIKRVMTEVASADYTTISNIINSLLLNYLESRGYEKERLLGLIK